METIYKLLLFLLMFIVTFLVGFKVYAYLNERIKATQTAWGLMAYSLLLLSFLSALFFASLYVLVWIYSFLSEA